MQRCLYYISGMKIPRFTHRILWLIVGANLIHPIKLCAQDIYQCTLKIYKEPGKLSVKKTKWITSVEKLDNKRLISLLGKLKISDNKTAAKPLVFNATSNHSIHLNFALPTNLNKHYEHILKLTSDSSRFQQTQKILLDKNTSVTIELQQKLLVHSRQSNSRLWVTTQAKECIQGVSGIRVSVKYVLPPGIKPGIGYIKALMNKHSPKPLWVYRIKKEKLVNDLIIGFEQDTTQFELFLPYHERPYWKPSVGFQLIHVDEARLLENFGIKAKHTRTDGYDVAGQVFLKPVTHPGHGVLLGLKLKPPSFYAVDLRKNFITLHFSGEMVQPGSNIWHYKTLMIDQLAKDTNKVIFNESFVPYAWLAKYADTIQFRLRTKMFLTAHRGTQFYTGYPRQQSHQVMYEKRTTAVTLPPMHHLKIRPVFLKIRKKHTQAQNRATIPYSQTLRLNIRINKYTLYQSRNYAYKKIVRFYKVNKDTLRLVKNDKITLEVTDNSYPPQVIFSKSLKCSQNILKQKFWKLKDKYGNYLKIAVQKLTTTKDKFLHTNGKNQTKTLGGRR